ncbi:MAG: Mce family protein [Nocardia sp.]|nr:Mce family protein [Nocardia sp.]
MGRTVNQDFIRGSDRHQIWMLNIAAVSVIAVVVVSFAGYRVWHPTFHSSSTIDVGVDIPAVAPGVHKGTKVIVQGNEVGEITALTRRANRSVRMNLALHTDEVRGITDAVGVDFRPENYFGVTAVNLLGKPGGATLVSGEVLDRTAAADYTMSTMLEKGSIVVSGSLTQSMVDTLNKVVRYTDGLTPWIRAGIVFTDRIAKTQQAAPSVLLGDLDRTLDVLPSFSGQAIEALFKWYDNVSNHNPDGSWVRGDDYWNDENDAMNSGLSGLFGAAGKLLKSHDAELTPPVQMAAALLGATPTVMAGGQGPTKVSALADRYRNAFTGPGNAKTLNLRLVLDNIPAAATPLAVAGLPATPGQEGAR